MAVAAGVHHSCAITMNGEVMCFGKQEHGRCNIPLNFPRVKAISAGVRHTCVITLDDILVCFCEGCNQVTNKVDPDEGL